MDKLFEISLFDSYREDNRREVKKASGGLPISLWETYSAMANTYGGVIILGVRELEDRSWETTGLKYADKDKLLNDLWNQVHNIQKVSINLLNENDIDFSFFTNEVDDEQIKNQENLKIQEEEEEEEEKEKV